MEIDLINNADFVFVLLLMNTAMVLIAFFA